MRDADGRKKEASKVIQTKQSNTTHPRQSLFKKNELPRVEFAHNMYSVSWTCHAICPLLVMPAQLIRPGIGQSVSCTIGDSYIAHSCSQLSEL